MSSEKFNYNLVSSPLSFLDESSFKICQIEFSVGDLSKEIFSLNNLSIPDNFDRMVNKRRCEYLAGRLCARKALKVIASTGSYDVLVGADRAPIWPGDVIGSISHSKGKAIACVANNKHYSNIGVDVEQLASDESAHRLYSIICPEIERYTGSAYNFSFLFTLIFSAKEAVFKALYKDVKHIFDFDAVECIAVSHESLEFEIKKDLSTQWGAGQRLEVLYISESNTVYTLLLIRKNA